MLRGLPFFWLVLVRAHWAADGLWIWREVVGTLMSDTENNTEFPQVVRSPNAVTGPGHQVTHGA